MYDTLEHGEHTYTFTVKGTDITERKGSDSDGVSISMDDSSAV